MLKRMVVYAEARKPIRTWGWLRIGVFGFVEVGIGIGIMTWKITYSNSRDIGVGIQSGVRNAVESRTTI